MDFKTLYAKIPVLRSPRFWALFFIVLVEFLQTQGIFDQGASEDILSAFQVLLGGAAAIKTVDRFGEKAGNKK